MSLPPDFDPDAPAAGEDGLYGLPYSADEAAIRVLAVPFEATTSFGRGTAEGPAAILEASWQVDLTDIHVGEVWKHGLALVPEIPEIAELNRKACEAALPIIEAGGAFTPEHEALLQQVNAAGERLNTIVREQTLGTYRRGQIPAVLGGDHAVPFGAIAAAAEVHGPIGILHFDAHADLREAYEGFTWSHASIFFNVLTRIRGIERISQVGLRDVGRQESRMAAQDPRIDWFTWPALAQAGFAGRTWNDLCQKMIANLPQKVWVSFDIDGLSPDHCPGTGTPVPGGLGFEQAIALLDALARSGREIVGFDLCEVAGQPWDANVGARLLYKLAGFTLATQPAQTHPLPAKVEL